MTTPIAAVTPDARSMAIAKAIAAKNGPITRERTKLHLDEAAFSRLDRDQNGTVDEGELAARLMGFGDENQKSKWENAIAGKFFGADDLGKKALAILGYQTAADKAAEKEAARLASLGTKAGMTAKDDLLMSEGPVTLKAIPDGPMAFAEAKHAVRQAGAKAGDVFILKTAEGLVQASSKAFTVDGAAPPAEGEALTVIAAGRQVQGTVVFRSFAPRAGAGDVTGPAPARRERPVREESYLDKRQRFIDSYNIGRAIGGAARSSYDGIFR